MIEVADQARNKWRSILAALGVDDGLLSGKHGPCPICGGRDRFRFDDKDGRGTWYCNACGAGDGIALLRKKHGWDFKEMAAQVRAVLGEAVEEAPRQTRNGDPEAASRRLWNGGRPLTKGDAAGAYLAARLLAGPVNDLRFAPQCAVTGVEGVSSLPALLALVRDPDGCPTVVHRTYLGDRAKADIDSPRRMMPGKLVKGSAIRLYPYKGILGVAEGIETAMAVYRDFRIPCWSTINATMMREFIWPVDVTELHIFADNDENLTGHHAAYTLGNRAMTARAPIKAIVHLPPQVGDDWESHGNRQLVQHAA